MKKIFYVIVLCLNFSLSHNSFCGVIPLKQLEEAMLRSNPDLKLLKLKESFAREKIILARSGYYPTLSSSWVVNEGEGADSINSPMGSSSSSSSSSSVPSASSSSSVGGPQNITSDGWSGDLTLSLGIFNRFSVSTALKNSKIGNKIAQMSVNEGVQNKRAQLLQLILEINSLRAIRKTLSEAKALTDNVKKMKAKNDYALFSKNKSLKSAKFYAELDYQNSKVDFAWSIATEGFFDLIPEADRSWLGQLPNLKVNFERGGLTELKKKFLQDNIGLKKLALDIKTFQNVYKQSQWEKPWIPQFNITSSLSKKRDWEGTLSGDETWAVTALLTFNLFDGFYTQARRAQASLSYRMAQEFEKSSKSKKLINLERQYRQADMALARHKFMQTKVNIVKARINNLKSISNSGVGMKNEKTAILLELSKYQWESLDELKKYQQQLLSLAQETNQMEKIRISHE
jgi:hypothetical protein